MTAEFHRFSPSRLFTIAMSTVTQLVRMRIIIFLAVFCAIVVAAGFLMPVFSPHHAAEQQLKQLKDVSFGALFFFSVIIAIVATALLLPRDVEDRTLYTILAKPVPRFDYLLGKLLGVLMVIASGVLVMDVVFCIVLYIKQGMVLQEVIETMTQLHQTEAAHDAIVASATKAVAAQGLTWSLQAGVWCIFLKAAVLTTTSLLISCFASSTLFTVVSSFCIFILGHGEGMMRDYLFHGGYGPMEKAFSTLISILCPDLSLFDAVDTVIAGKEILFSDVMSMTGIGALYVVGYFTVAHLIFVEKEL